MTAPVMRSAPVMPRSVVEDNLLLVSPTTVHRPSSALHLRLKPNVAASTLERASSRASSSEQNHRRPPQLPPYVTVSSLPAKSATFVASKGSKTWDKAWAGSKLGWRSAPAELPTQSQSIDSQAAAGMTLMKLALSRPVAREAWSVKAKEEAKRQADAKRQHELRERRRFHEKLNPRLQNRPPPPDHHRSWRPPPASKLVVQYGRNIQAVEQALAQRAAEEAAVAASELAKEREERTTMAQENLKVAVDAEAEWWEWYWEVKREREIEAKRKEEEAKIEELKRLRARYA